VRFALRQVIFILSTLEPAKKELDQDEHWREKVQDAVQILDSEKKKLETEREIQKKKQEDAVAQSKRAYEQVQKEYQQYRQKTENQINSLNEYLHKLEFDLKAAKETVGDHAIQSKESEILTKKTSQDYESKLASLKEQYEKELQKWKSLLEKNEGSRSQMEKQISEFTEQSSNWTKERRTFEDRIKSLDSTNKDLESKLSTYQNDLNVYKSQRVQLEKQLEDLKRELDDSKRENVRLMNQWKQDMEHYEKVNREHKEEFYRMEKVIHNMKQGLDQRETMKQCLEQEVIRTNQKVEQMELDFKTYREDVEQRTKGIQEENTSKLHKIEQERDRLQSQLHEFHKRQESDVQSRAKLEEELRILQAAVLIYKADEEKYKRRIEELETKEQHLHDLAEKSLREGSDLRHQLEEAKQTQDQTPEITQIQQVQVHEKVTTLTQIAKPSEEGQAIPAKPSESKNV